MSAIKKIHKAGHTIGLHSKHHLAAPEYFEKYGAEAYFENEIKQELQTLANNGIPVRSFGYPYNMRTKETDAYLGNYFNRFRAEASRTAENYIPVDILEKVHVMPGLGIGEYYHTIEKDFTDTILLASKNNLCATFFSHNIRENANHIHMATELLEKCLAAAQKEGVLVVGFDQLP